MKYWILRSGSWSNDPLYCLVAVRSDDPSDNRSIYLGFRLVKTVKQ